MSSTKSDAPANLRMRAVQQAINSKTAGKYERRQSTSAGLPILWAAIVMLLGASFRAETKKAPCSSGRPAFQCDLFRGTYENVSN
eukprot:3230086-Amphidinium_carterae.1